MTLTMLLKIKYNIHVVPQLVMIHNFYGIFLFDLVKATCFDHFPLNWLLGKNENLFKCIFIVHFLLI